VCIITSCVAFFRIEVTAAAALRDSRSAAPAIPRSYVEADYVETTSLGYRWYTCSNLGRVAIASLITIAHQHHQNIAFAHFVDPGQPVVAKAPIGVIPLLVQG